MDSKLTIPALVLLSTVTFTSAIGAEVEYEFDKAHADITFAVSHLGFSSTHGRFNEFDGSLLLDTDDLSASSVQVSIKTASVETSFGKRNDHLKSADFFNVSEFPEMIFVSTRVEMQGSSKGTLFGDLTLLGLTHPVALDLTVNKIAPHPRSKNMTAGFTATGVVERSRWGMSRGVPGIADEIHIRLDVEAGEAKP